MACKNVFPKALTLTIQNVWALFKIQMVLMATKTKCSQGATELGRLDQLGVLYNHI